MEVHVLQFFSMLGNGGAENRMMDVYRHINKSLVQFDFAVLHEGEQFFDKEIKLGGSKKYVLPDPRKGLIKNYFALVRFFRHHREFCAVHAHLAWYSGIVLLAAKQAGIKIRIAHARDSAEHKRPLIDTVFCKIGQALIGLAATQRIAISKDAASNIFGNRVARKGKYLYVPNSIDICKYHALSEQEIAETRKRLGIPLDRTAYVCVANLRRQKNHTFLIDIVSELKRKRKEFIIYFIGDGVLQIELEEKVRQLDVSDCVVFMGARADVPEILGAFDAMIFPSLFEGLGGVVLEAQLVGIPSIVSDRVPDEADVGVGMVLRLPLDLSVEQWAEEIIRFTNCATCTYEEVIAAFIQKGYTITNTARAYLKEYGIPQEVIEKAVFD